MSTQGNVAPGSDSDLDPSGMGGELQRLTQLFVADAEARGLTPEEISAEWQAMMAGGAEVLGGRIEDNLHRIKAAPAEQFLAEDELRLLSCSPSEVDSEKARGGVCYQTLAVAKRRLILAMLFRGSQFILPQEGAALRAALPTEEGLFAQIAESISPDRARHSRLREILHDPNNGVDANTVIGAYMEPLIVCFASDPDCLRLLLDEGADANAGTEMEDETALEICVQICVDDPTGDMTSVRMLLERGATKVSGGGTALHAFATAVCESFISGQGAKRPISASDTTRLVALRDALIDAGHQRHKQDFCGQTWQGIILAAPRESDVKGGEVPTLMAALMAPCETEAETARRRRVADLVSAAFPRVDPDALQEPDEPQEPGPDPVAAGTQAAQPKFSFGPQAPVAPATDKVFVFGQPHASSEPEPEPKPVPDKDSEDLRVKAAMPDSPGPAFKLDLQALSNAVSAGPEPEPQPQAELEKEEPQAEPEQPDPDPTEPQKEPACAKLNATISRALTLCDSMTLDSDVRSICLELDARCWICLEGDSEGRLIRGCACRGSSGWAHEKCLVEFKSHAELQLVAKRLDTVEDFLDPFAGTDAPWHACSICHQPYTGEMKFV